MKYRKNYLSWDDTFMFLAQIISQRSKDPSTQAGSVIVSKDNIFLGMGYNGWARGIDQSDLPWDREGDWLDTKYPYVVHAEANAVYNSITKVRGSRLYCTLFPCNECAKAIIQNGVKEVIYKSDKYKDTKEAKASRKMFELAGVKLRQYKSDKKLEIK